MCEAARTAKTAQSAATTSGGTCSWVSTCTGPSQPSRGGSKDSMQTQLQAKDTMIHVGATNHCSRLTTNGTGSPDRTHTSTARTVTPSKPAMPPPGMLPARSIAGKSAQTSAESVRRLSPQKKYLDLLPTRGSGERVYAATVTMPRSDRSRSARRHPLELAVHVHHDARDTWWKRARRSFSLTGHQAAARPSADRRRCTGARTPGRG